MPMQALARWRAQVRRLKAETYALVLASKHPRTPWYARLVVAAVVAYLLCPLDLVPDFVPVLGLVDDLLLLPLGILLAVRLIPAPVLAECRAQAQAIVDQDLPATRWAALVIVGIWLALAALVGFIFLRRLVD